MGNMFAWMSRPEDVATDKWFDFLDKSAAVFLAVALLTIAAILAGYWISARRQKIHRPADLFGPFTPLRWLAGSLLGALLVGVLAVTQYRQALDTDRGLPGFVATMFLLELAVCAAVAYLLIAFVPFFTPPKFQYRPAPFLYKSKTAR